MWASIAGGPRPFVPVSGLIHLAEFPLFVGAERREMRRWGLTMMPHSALGGIQLQARGAP